VRLHLPLTLLQLSARLRGAAQPSVRARREARGLGAFGWCEGSGRRQL